jgi:5-(carboxyamino)imidazole ribonucleotide synthase
VLRGITNTTQYALHMRAIAGWPIPTIPVKGEAVLLPLQRRQMEAVATQIQIKPDWQWQFFPAGEDPVGELIVPGPLKHAFSSLAATEVFNIQ